MELPPLEKYPDSVFMQDPAVLGVRRSIIGRFGESSRRGEENVLVTELHHIELMKNSAILHIETPGTLEGGDLLITDKKQIFVGQSSRTNQIGILQFQECLREMKVTNVKTNLLHLLCGCSYIGESMMIITPELVSPQNFPGLKFIKLRKEDAYASDALYLGMHRVLIPSGYPNASNRLKEAGYTPIEVEVSEFRKGDGGVTCLCSPIYNTI